MQVHLKALGCRLNEAELESWARTFRGKGIGVTPSADEADLVVVNTCAVTEEAVRKSRKLLRRVQRDNPQVKLVVSGCLPSLKLDGESTTPAGVDLVVDNRHKDRLPEIVLERLGTGGAPAYATEPGENLLFAQGRQRAFIKVQDGCRYRCTYCVVTLARGEERSRPASEIVEEICQLSGEGIREIVLTGVHLGGYGNDIGTSISGLLGRVLSETDIPRIRLGSLEPWDIPDQLWDQFADPRLMPHLHLPLQSGSDSVLRRMARRCKTEEFRRLLATGRSRVPDLNVTTDIIVGFPGETDREFAETKAFVEGVAFGHVHIFPYSPRLGTKAAELPDQVEEAVKRERVRELNELVQRQRTERLSRENGKSHQILIEKVSDDGQGSGVAWGYSPNYFRVGVKHIGTETRENSIIRAVITGVNPKGQLEARQEEMQQ